jgi:predicted deacetylase
MSVNYIFRLDDASEYSDINKWNKIEDIFDEFNIRPIVAVTPDNKDSELFFNEYNPHFWDKVREWQNKEWTIAMHGYQHLFHSIKSSKLIFPFYDRSEFGGLSLAEQRFKIKNSLDIFKENDVSPSVWVAPAHSFDQNTLEALKIETNIKIVSDGIAFLPYYENDFYFIPQQLWNVQKKQFGLWTICLHPDMMSFNQIELLRKDILKSKVFLETIAVDQIRLRQRNKLLIDNLFSHYFWIRRSIALILKNLKDRFMVLKSK